MTVYSSLLKYVRILFYNMEKILIKLYYSKVKCMISVASRVGGW